jgi:hypothetical protein
VITVRDVAAAMVRGAFAQARLGPRAACREAVRIRGRFSWWLSETERVPDEVTEWAQWALCGVAGHYPVSDHCGLPDHDYCLWCGRATPGRSPRSLGHGGSR